MDLSPYAVSRKTFTRRPEGYDTAEVATFLQAVGEELRSLQMQLEFLQTGDVAAPGGVTGAAPLPRDMDPLESELTLDALKDAQADLVARVESTAKDLHDSLETGGRMAHPNHLRTARYQTPARTAAPSAASAVTSAAATTASSTPPPPPPAPVPPATAPPIQLTEADLNGEQLKEARDKLDNVLDDVMGSIRPSATDTD